MTASFTRTVKPALTCLEESELAISAALTERGVPAVTIDELLTAVHELLTNIINYARPAGGVKLELSIEDAMARVTFRDNGAGFRGSLADFREMPVATESGYGLAICLMLLDRVEYQRVGDENLWEIEKNYAGAEEVP